MYKYVSTHEVTKENVKLGETQNSIPFNIWTWAPTREILWYLLVYFSGSWTKTKYCTIWHNYVYWNVCILGAHDHDHDNVVITFLI